MHVIPKQFQLFPHRHPSAAKGHLHTIHPTEPRGTLYTPSTYFCHQHPSRYTVLIHYLYMFKPSQYSLIHSTCLLPFNSSYSTFLFIPKGSGTQCDFRCTLLLQLHFLNSFPDAYLVPIELTLCIIEKIVLSPI